VTVIIGVDPHKATHTAVAVDQAEQELDRVLVRATRRQLEQLQRWAQPFGDRVWAIESAGGLGYLLAQQLVGAGERVVDVPATLASRVRLLGTGRSDKNDPNDARSVAIAALRAPRLAEVQPADHAAVLRLLAKRNLDLSRERNRTANRLHVVLCELVPGGIAKELTVSRAVSLLETVEPAMAVDQARYEMARELLDDVRRLDAKKKEMNRRIASAVDASGTTVTEVFCAGPVVACLVLGYTGDVTRFRDRHHFAAYNGTAPVEMSSAGPAGAPPVATRQPGPQLRRPHRRGRPNPPGPQRRPCLLRPQGQGRQDQPRGPARPEAPHQRRHLPPARHRRRPHPQLAGPGRTPRERLNSQRGRLSP